MPTSPPWSPAPTRDAPTITVDGTDVSAEIRSDAVTSAVSPVSTVPAVRARLLELQRAIIGEGGIVVEGRDIGSVVWPDAQVKVYLTADAEARASRRAAEEGGSDPVTTRETLLARDLIDSGRATAPLRQVDGATLVDTTAYSLDDVVEPRRGAGAAGGTMTMASPSSAPGPRPSSRGRRLALRARTAPARDGSPVLDPTHVEAPRTDVVAHPETFRLHRYRATARAIIRRRYPVVLHGADRVPERGPVIFAANHVGIIDGPILAIFAPRPVHALTKREMFEGRLGPFLVKAGQIPLDRFQTDAAAVRSSLRVLRDGGAVGIFPEGSRGAGTFERFHRGAAYLAMVTGAPVVPTIMIGTREPGGHSSSMPPRGTRVDMVFGEPVTLPRTPWPRTREAVAASSRHLREQMLRDLDAALELTGRTLPGPLPTGENEQDPGGGVTEKSA